VRSYTSSSQQKEPNMTITMIERCQLSKLTSEAFEALREDIA